MSTYTVFCDQRRLCQGEFLDIAPRVLQQFQTAPQSQLLVFDDSNGQLIDFDYSAELAQVEAWFEGQQYIAEQQQKRGRGRPKMGVQSKEVTLLPRHWQWLKSQPGGASATLRRLVEQARKDPSAQRREQQQKVYRVMQSVGGDLPSFEEASRALFADDKSAFTQQLQHWPEELKAYLLSLWG